MTDQKIYERCSEEAAMRLLHPTQPHLLEAIDYQDRPVSLVMEKISDGRIKLAFRKYHRRRLASV